MYPISHKAPTDAATSGGACPYAAGAFDHARRWRADEAWELVQAVSDGSGGMPLGDAARLAWRESVRCIGRLHWRSLKVIDARSLDDADEVFEACVEHLRVATGDGRITPTQTVFAPWREGYPRVRIWNSQLIRYAGYRHRDGSVLGDPMNVAFTERVSSLGWSPSAAPGRFDLLPLVIEVDGRVIVRELPSEVVLEVELEHPEYSWFSQLGLRWHAVPAISDMLLVSLDDVFPCAPFNGWYMGTEIGARNLGDANRYNLLPEVAERLGLQRDSGLWKDRALLVLNEAVLHSFAREGVRMVDHHQASREFLAHCEREQSQGHEVQAEWSWIVPPISGSSTGVFHRLYPLQPRLPNLLPQVEAWKDHKGTAQTAPLSTPENKNKNAEQGRAGNA
ncbi:MAG: nitric oxide synthase oxygenase [Verrucomicrobiales bacterium]|nr:nitric oxide synthase oxygenase [Verrucomicrobiales bacterium]